MSWLERFGKKKEPDKKTARARSVTPVCSRCEQVIECLNVSIGDVIEEQGACVYSGSEGRLYEPLYEGSICLSCGVMLCDDCMSDLVDSSRCPKCGGMLRAITESRLPRAE